MAATILFLPGLDGEPFTAGKIAEHLRESRLIVFAYPTGRPLEWESLCRLVAARMDREGTQLLIGESFGGAIAQETALRHPGLLRGLFLLSTFNHEAEAFANLLGRAATRVLPGPLMRAAARGLAGWKLAGTLRGEDRRKFLDRFAALDMNDIASRLRLLAAFDTRSRLGALELPVEILHGSRDPIAGAPDQLNGWQALPDCRVHKIEGFGHLVSAEAAPQVAALIDAWTRKVAGGQAGNNRGD
jgi:pimeloyl-ACP methyl ester carboxylesterase